MGTDDGDLPEPPDGSLDLTPHGRITQYYNKYGNCITNHCIGCPARGTQFGELLWWCNILHRDIPQRECTNYDWDKYILEYI